MLLRLSSYLQNFGLVEVFLRDGNPSRTSVEGLVISRFSGLETPQEKANYLLSCSDCLCLGDTPVWSIPMERSRLSLDNRAFKKKTAEI